MRRGSRSTTRCALASARWSSAPSKGELAQWADGPRRRLSLILLLDQFPRNIYRGTARAFAGDEQALQLALTGMQSVADAALNIVERIFFYLPLQHCGVARGAGRVGAAYKRRWARRRRSCEVCLKRLGLPSGIGIVIRRFGRFPPSESLAGAFARRRRAAWLRGRRAFSGARCSAPPSVAVRLERLKSARIARAARGHAARAELRATLTLWPRGRMSAPCALAARRLRAAARLPIAAAPRTAAPASSAHRARAPSAYPPAAAPPSAARTDPPPDCQATRAHATAASGPTAHPPESASPPRRPA